MGKLTETQNKLKESARNFAESVIQPNATRLDKSGGFPREWFQQCGEAGFLNINFPVQYGGQGLGSLETVLVMEQLARHSGSLGVTLIAHTQCARLLLRYGTEAQKEEFLRPALKGNVLLSFAITENNGGSDVLGLETTAVREKEQWVLNGSKRWITNGGASNVYVLSAKTNHIRSRRGVSLFLVKENTPGLHVEPVDFKMGLHNTAVGNITLADCRIPLANLVGEENQGYDMSHVGLDDSRLYVSAVAVGLACGAFERALNYTRSREQFGRPLTSYQGVTFPLAEMYTRITSARAMLYEVAGNLDRGERIRVKVAALKLCSSEMCCGICDQALRLLGGNGYGADYELERFVRDSRALMFMGGTSEVCKIIISNSFIY